MRRDREKSLAFGLSHRWLAVTSVLAVLILGFFVVLLGRLAAGTAAGWLIVAAAIALSLSAVLFAASTGCLAWAVMRTTRQQVASAPAVGEPAQLTDGQAGARAGTNVLDRAFNVTETTLHQTRDELRRLIQEQTALRRVATLVAHAAPTPTVFAAVAAETGHILGADLTRMLRYEADQATTVVAAWGEPADVLPIDTRWTIVGRNIPSMVLNKCRPARMDCFIGAVSPLCVYLRGHGIHSGVGTPVIVDGKCWGVMTAFSTRDRLLPREAEKRIGDFTDLVAIAIAKSQAHAELSASRARIVTATDRARRQIERDLHDGTQQRLITLLMDLHTAETKVPDDAREVQSRLAEISTGLGDALNELQKTARGIHPVVLAKGGFVPAVHQLARDAPMRVRFDSRLKERLPENIEIAAYYVVAEALTNATKYAEASAVDIHANLENGSLHLAISDDGRGGADPSRGSGLIGLVDRIESLNGVIEITSPPGHGTHLSIELPVADACVPLTGR